MSPEERNQVWESAAAQLGLAVVAEATKLRRRRNRIEGVIDGVPVAVSYQLAGVYTSLTVTDAPYSNVMGEPVMDIFADYDPTDPSDIVAATRQALAAFQTLSSAPPPSRRVAVDNVGAVRFDNPESPQPVEILRALGAMRSALDDDGFIILSDTSIDEVFMQSARGQNDFLVDYRDGSVDQHFSTTVDTLEEALKLNLLWLANDQAWKTENDWTPVES